MAPVQSSLRRSRGVPCRAARVLGGLLLLVAWGPLLARQSPLDQGRRLLAQKHYREAVALLDEAKQAAPKDPQPYFYTGLALAESGHLREGIAELKKAVALGSDQPEFWLIYAELLSRAQQATRALEALEPFAKEQTVAQLSSRETWLLSDLYYRLEKLDDALRVLEQLGKKEPTYPRLALRRGDIQYKRGEMDAALTAYRLYQKQAPQDPRGFYGEGRVLFLQNDLVAAKKSFQKAVDLAPENPEYLAQLGLVCLSRDEAQEAILHLERAASPRYPRIYRTLATAYRKAGDSEKARIYLKKFQELTSRFRTRQARRRKALLRVSSGKELIGQGRVGEARLKFEEALELDPKQTVALAYLAKIYMSSGYWPLARRMLTRLQQEEPDDYQNHYLWAEFWYRRRRYRRALAAALKAKEIRPGHGELRNLLGNIYLSLGEPEKAALEYAAAVRLQPEREDFRINLKTVSKP